MSTIIEPVKSSYRIQVTLPQFYFDFVERHSVFMGTSRSEIIRMALLFYMEEVKKLRSLKEA